MAVAEHLAPGLRDPPVGERHRLDAAAHAVASLEHDDVGAAAREVARRRQAGEPSTKDRHIDHRRSSSHAPALTGLQPTPLDSSDEPAVVF